MEQRFSHIEIEGRHVEVMEYSTKEHVQIFMDSLSDFDPYFSVNYRKKSQLRKMPIIHSFLTSPEHCRITEFTFVLRMCGNEVCTLCALIKLKAFTTNV